MKGMPTKVPFFLLFCFLYNSTVHSSNNMLISLHHAIRPVIPAKAGHEVKL
jgi:hypothetical protein